MEELQRMYLAEDPFYYLYTAKQCNKILINVVNGNSGEAIYSFYPKLLSFTYNIKTKDLKELGKRIDKIK